MTIAIRIYRNTLIERDKWSRRHGSEIEAVSNLLYWMCRLVGMLMVAARVVKSATSS